MPHQELGDHGNSRVTARGPWRLTKLRAADLRFIHVLSGAHGRQVEIQELLTGVGSGTASYSHTLGMETVSFRFMAPLVCVKEPRSVSVAH